MKAGATSENLARGATKWPGRLGVTKCTRLPLHVAGLSSGADNMLTPLLEDCVRRFSSSPLKKDFPELGKEGEKSPSPTMA